MYARTTTMQADPARIDAGIAHVRDQVFPAVTAMGGCIGMSMLVDRGSGRCIATTAWESESALRDSAELVRPLRDGAEQALGSSSSDVDTWEVAVVHRDHAMPDAAWSRVAWMSSAPETAERAIDIFKMAVLPKLQELNGFCSASLMISRETGRTAGTFIYDSREQLEETREAAGRLREAASRERGATIDDVAEMEVAFAHLHVPELV